jgi:hypothetical protein
MCQWLRERGCWWGPRNGAGYEHDSNNTTAFAAYGGHLAVLVWAWYSGCPWDSLTTAYAAQGGHLAVLQWARRNGCPW